MADRHKYWPHRASCATCRADYFSAIDEFRPCATLDARLLIGANEARFCYSNRRHIGEHTQVAGQAETARMSCSAEMRVL